MKTQKKNKINKVWKVKKIKKPWGSFVQFTHNQKSTVKILRVNPGGILSLQSHRKRSEFWWVLEGNPTIVLGIKKRKYKKDDSVKIGKGVKHRIINNTNSPVKVLEISLGDFKEDDIVRFEDKYGRLKAK